METQTCTKCLGNKPLAEFHYITRSQRHDTRCKLCISAYLKGRRASLPHVTKAEGDSCRRYIANKRKANPDFNRWKSKTKAQKQAAYQALARWRAKNKERYSSEAHRAVQLRRSRQFIRAWPLIVEHYGGKCLNCGRVDGLCFDHVVPLSKGGDNQLTNGQPLCRACNAFKGQLQQSDKDWRPDQGAWIVELVKRNPWMVLNAGKRGWHLTSAGRKVAKEQAEAREAGIVVP